MLHEKLCKNCISFFILYFLFQGHLYIGTAMEVQRLPLADCSRYGDSCRECILSRDPYCAWDLNKKRCLAIPANYNVTTGYVFSLLKYMPNISHSIIFVQFYILQLINLCGGFLYSRLLQSLDQSNASVCGDTTGKQ